MVVFVGGMVALITYNPLLAVGVAIPVALILIWAVNKSLGLRRGYIAMVSRRGGPE